VLGARAGNGTEFFLGAGDSKAASSLGQFGLGQGASGPHPVVVSWLQSGEGQAAPNGCSFGAIVWWCAQCGFGRLAGPSLVATRAANLLLLLLV